MGLAFKDVFDEISVFQKIDNFLLQLSSMYENSPKWLRGLQELLDAYQDSIPKPAKANGTRWLECKYSAIKTTLENFWLYMIHFDELVQTDSNRKKKNSDKGLAKILEKRRV